MASREDYVVGLVCRLSVEVAAAKSALDRVHDNLPTGHDSDGNNTYILGNLQGHNVVVAYPKVYGKSSLADVTAQLHASYPSVRFNLMVGIEGGACPIRRMMFVLVMLLSVSRQLGVRLSSSTT